MCVSVDSPLCVSDKARERDPAADVGSGRGDWGTEGDLLIPAAGGGSQDQEAEEGKMTRRLPSTSLLSLYNCNLSKGQLLICWCHHGVYLH